MIILTFSYIVCLMCFLICFGPRIKQKFITKQSKAKETIDHLKKKVEKYEEQLHFIKNGGEIEVSPPRYGDKMRNRIKKIG